MLLPLWRILWSSWCFSNMDKSLALSTCESVERRVIFLAGMYPKGSLEMRTPLRSVPESVSSEMNE